MGERGNGMPHDGEHYIVVNLPSSEEDYLSGNGEGVWVEVDDDTIRDYDNDMRGYFYHGVLANDSLYYPGLSCGMTLPFEMRGVRRPVASYKWLSDNYGESRKDEALAMLAR